MTEQYDDAAANHHTRDGRCVLAQHDILIILFFECLFFLYTREACRTPVVKVAHLVGREHLAAYRALDLVRHHITS